MNYHRLYLDSVFALAETLVIKSEYSAEVINNQLLMKYGNQSVDLLNPQTWKYYLNVCGEYHPTDSQIMVRSLDTMQTIAFTKQNLLTHVATARGYRYGSRYYRELATQNPGQELLLMGILYPANMDEALAAKDMQVLSYPTYLVEENEDTLIVDINAWLTKFNHRWNIPAFNLTDELYGASLMGVMYAQLVPLIITLRLRACRTAQAHSYHVRQYLASHGMLDSYLNFMTRKQAMFFYRNAAYIERNSGKTSTFEWLTDQILTERGLPLTEYRMHHQTSGMPSSLTPEVVFRTSALNKNANAKVVSHTVDSILAKELPLARGNSEWIGAHANETQEKLKYTLKASAKTKMLESSLVDNTTTNTHSVQDVALALWGYSAATNAYNVYLRIKNPVTGAEMSLSMLQAYYYFIYAYCQVHTVQLQTVPKIYAQHIPRTPTPTLEELMQRIDPAYVDKSAVQAVLDLHAQPMPLMNAELFNESCTAIYNAATAQTQLVAKQEHFYSRALLESAFLALYGDFTLSTPETGQDIKNYLSLLDLPAIGFSAMEWQQIYLDLYQQATGFDMQATLQSSEVQKAMVRLMTQLSSYSVQFVSEVTGQEIKSLNWAAIRLGDSSGSSRGYFELLTSVIDIFESKVTTRMRIQVPVKAVSNSFAFALAPQHQGDVELTVSMSSDKATKLTRVEAVLDIGGVGWDHRYDPNALLESENNAVYAALSSAEIAQIENVYDGLPFAPAVIPVKRDLSLLLHQPVLNSFQALPNNRLSLAAWDAFWGPQHIRYFSDDSTVVVLEGIWPLGGTQNINVFVRTAGISKIESFKYLPQAYVPLTADVFHASSGQLKSVTFAQGRAVGDVELGSLTHITPETELTLQSVTQPVELIPFINHTTVADMTLSAMLPQYEFSLTHDVQEHILAPITPVTKLVYLSLSQMPNEVELSPLENATIDHEGMKLSALQGVWNITLINQLAMREDRKSVV